LIPGGPPDGAVFRPSAPESLANLRGRYPLPSTAIAASKPTMGRMSGSVHRIGSCRKAGEPEEAGETKRDLPGLSLVCAVQRHGSSVCAIPARQPGFSGR
jgi:hypothetical protein